jgi:hypothetical protein
VAVPNTGGWGTFADVSATLSGVPTGTTTLYLTFAGAGSGLFDVDDFTLVTAPGGGTGGFRSGTCLDAIRHGTTKSTSPASWTCTEGADQKSARS